MIKTFHYKLVEVRTSATAYIIAVQLLSRKIKVNKKFYLCIKKQNSSTSTSATGENIYLFVFISLHGACIYVQYFFDIVKNQT